MTERLGSRGHGALRGLCWIAPWIAGFLLFTLTPAAMSLYYSTTDYSILEPPLPIGLDNYRELLGDSVFWITVRNTAIYAFFSVTLGTVVALTLALLLRSRGAGAAACRAAVFLPTLVPLVPAALSWMWIYNGEVGLLDALLDAIGIRGPNWLAEKRWAMAALILMSLWHVGGAVVIYVAALRDVPRSLDEAASVDGASPLRRLVFVTLPQISPAILFNVIISLIWSLQIFAAPLIMTEGGPDNATNFYTMYLYQNAFVYQRMGYASAMAWLQLAAVVALTAMLLAVSRRFVFYRAR